MGRVLSGTLSAAILAIFFDIVLTKMGNHFTAEC